MMAPERCHPYFLYRAGAGSLLAILDPGVYRQLGDEDEAQQDVVQVSPHEHFLALHEVPRHNPPAMFGAYRLVLALLVAVSHYGLIVHGFNPGQWAVIGFYLLSGFLMSRQFKKLAPQSGLRGFYIDRALRILPLYWFVTCVSFYFIRVSWTDFAQNIALLPLNYAPFTHAQIIVSPAWSLACEAHFYILVPLLVMAPSRVLHLLLFASVSVFCASPWLPANAFWAYGGLPGILFTFLSGILIDRGEWRSLRAIYVLLGVLLVVFLAGKSAALKVPTGININVAIGYLFALPLTFALARLSPKRNWDQVLGLLSFPLFLDHVPVRTVCHHYFPSLGPAETLAVAVFSAAVLLVAVEKPFDQIRYWARK